MHTAGLEPARISPTDLETVSLTTRTRMRRGQATLECDNIQDLLVVALEEGGEYWNRTSVLPVNELVALPLS